MSDPVTAGDDAGLTLTSGPRSVARARRYAVEAAVAHGWGAAADTVALLVSELATNALLHAYGPEIRIRVQPRGSRLRVEVQDGSPSLPVPRHAAAGAEDGRGMGLVQALAGRWGVETRADGKTLWFELGT